MAAHRRDGACRLCLVTPPNHAATERDGNPRGDWMRYAFLNEGWTRLAPAHLPVRDLKYILPEAAKQARESNTVVGDGWQSGIVGHPATNLLVTLRDKSTRAVPRSSQV